MHYAEVIGDPIAHSRSPAIHRHWLSALGVRGDFRATQVRPGELAPYVERRRDDLMWRGCSLTAPHKETVIPLLDGLTEAAARVGAVNCLFREDRRLVGTNTDLDGLTQALLGIRVSGGRAVIIGAGGAARAALDYLRSEQPTEIVLLVRDLERAAALQGQGVRAAALAAADEVIAGARLVINASPLGMKGAPPMPSSLLGALAGAPDAAVLDMVYHPLETELLDAARKLGLHAVDGLEMLIGQARQAFRLFFGANPPAETGEIRALLTRLSG